MSLEKHIVTDGIVLKTTLSGCYNRIADFITPDRGVLKASAYGAMRLNNRFCSTLQAYTTAKFYLTRDSKSGFLVLKDISEVKPADFIANNLQKYYFAAMFSEILLATNISDHEFKSFYKLMQYSLELLDNTDPYPSLMFFSAKYIVLSGYSFDINGCYECREQKNINYLDINRGGILCDNHAETKTLPLTRDDICIFKGLLNDKYAIINQNKSLYTKNNNILSVFKLFFKSYIDIDINKYIL